MALNYPAPGCIVEYLEDNSLHTALVLEESSGKLRLLLPGRRETKLATNRVLPWIGPAYSATLGKDEAVRLIEEHRKRREEKARQIPALELWELAQGEITQAPASWFAELMETSPDIDAIAAYGRALLACKTHFRFQPPEFQVYNEDTVEKRATEQRAREEKEALANQGAAFIKMLWEVASRRKPGPDASLIPDEPLAGRIRKMLFSRVINPDSTEDEALWRLLGKGLPEVPHVPLQLLMAWGLLPQHYNFWLDRADFARGDDWWRDFAPEVDKMAASIGELAASELPFISIDGPKTIDIDDAFHIERLGDGWRVNLAFACPALLWPFGEPLDKLVIHRATSIYLPEGDLHMLPEVLGTNVFSLLSAQPRPAFCLKIDLDSTGACTACEPYLAQANLAANLRFGDVQALINDSSVQNPASPYLNQIQLAHDLALRREALRVKNGAVVMLREEPDLRLEKNEEEIKVILEREKPIRDAQRLVSELMILASSALADWAHDCGIPLLHRTQNVALPHEYAGVWSNPADLAKIMRSLIPSSLETTPRPHSALGLSRYAQVTSPLRRYPDLINEAQIMHFLKAGAPKWDESDLKAMLNILGSALELAGHVQRFRPRYWKLLYLRQQGEQAWYKGIVTEENENFVNVTLPVENLQVRGRRNVFDDRVCAGQPVQVRLGKINPLYNEVHILESLPDDSFSIQE